MDSQMEDAPLDVQGASSSDDVGPLLLSDSERKLLELYDRLQELQLEIALLKAQQNHQPCKKSITLLTLSSTG